MRPRVGDKRPFPRGKSPDKRNWYDYRVEVRLARRGRRYDPVVTVCVNVLPFVAVIVTVYDPPGISDSVN